MMGQLCLTIKHLVGTNNRWIETCYNRPVTADELYTSLSTNTIATKLTNHLQRTKLITPSTDKHCLVDFEDEFRSGCRNVGRQQQFYSELHSPGRSDDINYWYSSAQNITTFIWTSLASLRGGVGILLAEKRHLFLGLGGKLTGECLVNR